MHGTGDQTPRINYDLAQSYSKYSNDQYRITEFDSDEDTEDASETDMMKEEEYRGMKEQAYQDKLGALKKQLQVLKDGAHPEYERRLKKLEQSHRERVRLNEVCHAYELECIERDYVNEKKAAVREFEEKKLELKENLISELEERRKLVETEHLNMDFTGDFIMDVKPITTRKLRRRPNDPVPIPEKRRKLSPAQLNYLLDDQQILDDLKAMNKGRIYSPKKAINEYDVSPYSECSFEECRIEDGKLYYDKRWYQRGQNIYVESKETGRLSAIISTIGPTEVWVRKSTDHNKIKIPLFQLQKGKFVIRRKST